MISIAIIGTSLIAEKFVWAAGFCDQCKIEAVYSRNMERARAFAAKQNIKRCFDSLQELAEDKDINAVYIASPNAFHCEQVLLMAEYGKHILCEKALASNSAEVDRMFRKAEEKEIVLLEAMRSLHDPGYIMLKENLGKLGKLKEIKVPFGRYSSKYDDFLAGNTPNIFNRECSAGSLMDMGVYSVEPVAEIFGMPDSITASAEIIRGGIDGKGQIQAEYGDLKVCMSYSKIDNLSWDCEFIGEKGTMYVTNIARMKKIWIVYRDGSEEVIRDTQSDEDNNMMHETQAFINAIDGKLDVKYYEKVSRITMKIMDQARKICGIEFPADL